MNEQKDKYIQEQRNKIREKETKKALKDAEVGFDSLENLSRDYPEYSPRLSLGMIIGMN